MSGAPKQMDASLIWSRIEINQGTDVSFPGPLLIFCIRRKVNEVPGIQFGELAFTREPFTFKGLLGQLPLPLEKLSTLGGTPMSEVIGPVYEVPGEPQPPPRSPRDF